MTFKQFHKVEELIAEGIKLVRKHMQMTSDKPHAIMLSGGNTPLPVYKLIAANPFPVSNQLYIMECDERMAPETSAENNFAGMSRMLSALSIPATNILKVQTALPHQKAADKYDNDLKTFFDKGGALTLAVLGMGADGHTASLFSKCDVNHQGNRFAIATAPKGLIPRVSVTSTTIARASEVVFLVTGAGKNESINKLMYHPESIVAGLAVRNVSNVEVWHSGL